MNVHVYTAYIAVLCMNVHVYTAYIAVLCMNVHVYTAYIAGLCIYFIVGIFKGSKFCLFYPQLLCKEPLCPIVVIPDEVVHRI